MTARTSREVCSAISSAFVIAKVGYRFRKRTGWLSGPGVLRNRVGVAMTARVAESCGTLATVTDALTREELARTALACPPFALAIRLAEWVGDSRELTSTSLTFLDKLILKV